MESNIVLMVNWMIIANFFLALIFISSVCIFLKLRWIALNM
jgi:hypothetical protein